MARIISLISIVLTFICLSSVAGNQPDTTTLIIVSANDMHAKIDNFPKLKALVDGIRQKNEYVLLVSAGDMFTGNPVVDQYPDKGFPMIDLMNKTGFDLGIFGNHEFDYGQETLKKRIAQANFPLISANFKSTDPQGIHPQPYKIFTMGNGLRVGFVSVIQLNPAGLPDSHPSKLTGIEFTNGLEKIKEYKYLRDSCNVFVGLTHLGFEDDVKLTDDFMEFDLILGGHSHTTVKNPVEYNGVLVMQAGSGLKNVSKITLKLVNGKVVSKKAETISVINYPDQDSALAKDVEHYNDNKELNQVIGEALNDIDGNDELGSLMADGITHLDEITVAFQNTGGIRIDKLSKGNITIKDMYKLDPFGNEIILLRMNGLEIKSLISESFNREKVIDLQVSGLSYKVFTGADGNASEIKLYLPDGSEAGDNSVFNVGLSSYIVSSYNFNHSDAGKTLYITTAQALINFISEKKAIDYKGVKRAFVEPAR